MGRGGGLCLGGLPKRPPGQRTPQTETPWTEIPQTETPRTETPLERDTPSHVTCSACWDRDPPWTEFLTHACKNITLEVYT